MALVYPVLAAEIDGGVIRVTEDGATFTIDVIVPSGFLYGDGSEADDFCRKLAAALSEESGDNGAGGAYTCEYVAKTTPGGVTGTLVITGDVEFGILWEHANTTLNPAVLGFPATNQVEALTQTSTLSPSHTWVSNQPAVRLDPDSPVGDARVLGAGDGSVYIFQTEDVTDRRVDPYLLIAADRSRTYLSTSDPARAFESFWRLARVKPIRLYRGGIDSGTTLETLDSTDLVGTYVLEEQDIQRMPPMTPRQRSGSQAYDFELGMREWVK